jgi:hypothetical protein
MTESTRSVVHRVMLVGRVQVVDDVVLARRGAQSSNAARRQAIEPERMARLPRDVVIGARSIAADADGPDFLAAGVIQGQAASEDIDTTDELADKGS